MYYDFNKKIDRTNSHSVKWDELEEHFSSHDLLPMWVADMDFETAPEILEAMQKKLDQKIFGYVSRSDAYFESAANWTSRRYGYAIDPKTLLHSPGVVPSISFLLRTFTEETDKILIQPPVYYPFANSINRNKRKLATSPLIEKDGIYRIDFADFEEKAADPDVKWFILSNPHNPVGRVWTKEELEQLADICIRHGVRVIADEIWRDLVFKGHRHIPFASLSKEAEAITITCFSASKTFNLAGLQASFISLPREEEFRKFNDEMEIIEITRNNPFSLVAVEAAFTKGEPWLEALLLHLESNIDFFEAYLKKHIPQIKVTRPEGTYLLWLDFRALGLSNEALSDLLQKEGKIALDDGFWFGTEGSGFMRMNIACPRYILEDGLARIQKAVETL